MGDVVYIDEYLERREAETNPDAIRARLAELALKKLVIQSEQNRLERLLFEAVQKKSEL